MSAGGEADSFRTEPSGVRRRFDFHVSLSALAIAERSLWGKTRAAVWIAALAAALVAFLFFAALPTETLLRDWMTDDSFYYLGVAKNLAREGAASFDGRVSTNGVHWPFALLVAPAFWLPLDAGKALVAVKAIEIGLGLASLAVFAALLRRLRITPLALWPALVGLCSQPILYKGLEAGLNVFLFVAALLAIVRAADGAGGRRFVRWLAAGLVLSVSVWTREENLLFALAAAAAVPWIFRRSPAGIGSAVLGLALPVGISVVAYLGVNLLLFDAPFSASLMAKSWWSETLRLQKGIAPWAIGDTLPAMLARDYVRDGLVWGGLAAILILAGGRLEERSGENVLARRAFHGAVLALAACHAMRTLAYAMQGHPLYTLYEWYHVSSLPLAWAAAAILAEFLQRWADRPSSGPDVVSTPIAGHRFAPMLHLGFRFLAIGLVVCGFAVYHIKAKENWTDWEVCSYRMAGWLNATLPPDAVVGALDAGVLGYFTDAAVIDLDGLANSPAYVRQLMAGRMDEALSAGPAAIGYFANLVPIAELDVAAHVGRRARQPGPLKGEFALERFSHDCFYERWPGRWMTYRLYRYTPPAARPQP
ncbi:MAG: hypothetical protein C4523_06135 [Myxococcales bacterium]|nr:MAG: hypothetical protein C4523_06135 [Myxococcales bacterium]